MTAPSHNKSDPAHRNTESNDVERIVEERTAALQNELDVLRRQNADLRKVDAAFRESESQLKLALKGAGAGMWIRDPDGGWIATPQLNVLFGRSPDAPPLREEEFPALIHPDDLPDLRNAWRDAIQNGSRFEQEYRIIWQDGSVHWLTSKGRVCLESGIPRFIGMTYDITGKKQAEDALIEREEELQNLIESSGDGIIITDHEGRITTWNTGAEKITGLAANEVTGVPAWEIQARSVSEEWAGPDPQTLYRTYWDQMLRDDTDYHFIAPFIGQIRTPNGDVRYIQQSVFRIPTRQGFRIGCIMRDVTERKLAEVSLRESEDKFRKLVQSTHDGIILNDDTGVIREWNTGMEEIFSISREEAIGRPFPVVALRFAPDEKTGEEWVRSIIKEMDRNATTASKNPFIELSIRRPDGTPRIIEAKMYHFPFHGRKFYGGIVRDVTWRKGIEDAILENETMYRTLIEMSPDIVMIHQYGKIVYANPALEKLLTTRTLDNIIGMNVFDLLHPDSRATVRNNIQDDLDGTVTPMTEVRIVRGDGSIVTFEGKGRRILYKGKPAIMVVIRDVTERKAAEQKLREYTENLKRSNDDLELFASIATHDLQEPIRGIVTYSQLLLSQCRNGQNSRTEQYLKIIENSGLRMNTLVSDLREYSRVRTKAKPLEPVDTETIFTDALSTLRLVIKETRASITHDQLPVVLCDGTQVTQVFQNIIDNAIKFRKKGIAPEIQITAAPRNGMWQFAIRDNGIGIPPEYTDKIFILFERLHGRDTYPGTGLGLALCKQIIERHGGRIWIDSEVGVGSTFFFTLPAVSS
jgi:PAS domain S-box-containing protein